MLQKILTILCIIFVASCAPKIPEGALKLQPESLQMRSLQTRSFNTNNDTALLAPSVNSLQDLGFDIDFTEKKLGVIVGSKTADAVDYGEIAGKVALAILFGSDVSWDKNQKIKASLFITPAENTTKVRVTFQRMVWNNRDELTKLEPIIDPEIYQTFFSNISKSVFLDANEI